LDNCYAYWLDRTPRFLPPTTTSCVLPFPMTPLPCYYNTTSPATHYMVLYFHLHYDANALDIVTAVVLFHATFLIPLHYYFFLPSVFPIAPPIIPGRRSGDVRFWYSCTLLSAPPRPAYLLPLHHLVRTLRGTPPPPSHITTHVTSCNAAVAAHYLPYALVPSCSAIAPRLCIYTTAVTAIACAVHL